MQVTEKEYFSQTAKIAYLMEWLLDQMRRVVLLMRCHCRDVHLRTVTSTARRQSSTLTSMKRSREWWWRPRMETLLFVRLTKTYQLVKTYINIVWNKSQGILRLPNHLRLRWFSYKTMTQKAKNLQIEIALKLYHHSVSSSFHHWGIFIYILLNWKICILHQAKLKKSY